MTERNPLLESHTFPPVDQIKVEHFVPAFEAALEKAEAHYQALKADTSEPTFENTVMAIDNLWHDIGKIQEIMGTFYVSKTSPELTKAYETVSQQLATFSKKVYQDQELAARFEQVEEPETEEDKTLYRGEKRSFERAGAFLSPEGQSRIKEIDSRLITLCNQFNENCDEAAKQQAVLFTDPKEIEGLPASIVSNMRENAQKAGHESGWLFTPERLQVDMLLEIAPNRNFRERIFKALARIGTEEPYDNAPVIKEIQALRHERATMLDYPHYSDYAMEGMMPEDVKTVHRFLEKVGEGALDKFSDTMGKISAYAKSQDGPEKLEPWDVAYWGGKYKEEAFGFDAQKFSEYLPLEQSIDGFFNTAERIFGITFEERDDLPLYHPDVRTFEVKNTQTGESHGFLYADMYAREGKTGGAWMSSLQSPEEGKPNIVTLNMNLMKPSEGQTAQLSLRDLETLFHEGGHAIHGLLGTDTRHPSLVGTASSSDYVEFFSTVLENWPNQEACLKTFARHHKTGEAIPDELIQSWKDSSEFLSEAPALKLVQNSLRDLLFHSSDPKEYTTSKAIEDKADFDHPLADHICAYPLQRWGHLFSSPQSGYASGYFGYLWSESLAKIGFKPFEKNGIYDPETCENLASIYRKGGSWDQTKAYEAFHGGKVTPEEMADAVLESIGASKRLTRNNAQTQSR